MFGQIDNNLMAWFLWGMDPKKRGKYQAKFKNDKIFVNFLQLLTNSAVNLFEWEGLPDMTSERFIEEAFLYSGNCALIKDPELGFLTLPFTQSSKINLYGEPNAININGKNGYSKEVICSTSLTDTDIAREIKVEAIPGYDNYQKYPYFQYILDYAERITQVFRSLDVAVKKLKNPYIIVANKQDELAYKQYINSLEMNEDAIMVAKGVDTDNPLSTTDIHIDTQVVDSLWNQYQRYYSDIMQILGINSNPLVDKVSGVSQAEVDSNNSTTNLNLEMRLKERNEWAEKCNEIFGTNISVKVRGAVSYDEDVQDNEEEEEGEE